MNLKMGGQVFLNIEIPLLWGKRAVLQDSEDRLSVIDLSGSQPIIEILGDEPAPEMDYTPISEGGFQIWRDGKPSYSYFAADKRLSSLDSRLPDCEIKPSGIRVGGSVFSNNTIEGPGVGIVVSETGIGMGARLPSNLAKLRI
jgi:hypothetical protein